MPDPGCESSSSSGRHGTLRRILAFVRLERRRKTIFLEALLWMAFGTAATRLLPFRWMRSLYGRPRTGRKTEGVEGSSAPMAVRERCDPVLGDVRWALRVLQGLRDPRRGCLARAIAGRMMLRRRGYAPTLHIGARRPDAGGEAELHAWLTVHGEPVTGVRGAGPFTTLAVFDDG